MEKTIHISSITDLHKLAGIASPEHPLLSIMRMEDLPTLPENYPTSFTYEFYSIGMKKNLKGYIEYGRKTYDFQEGLMGFTGPNQIMSFSQSDMSEATGWILFFQSELWVNSALVEKLHEYGFFEYAVNEALHLSQKEERLIENVFENIYDEYVLPIDKFSKNVTLSNLELLLTYAERFYARQFITRNEVDSTFFDKFQKELNEYFNSYDLTNQGIPSVELFAEKLNMSSSYLSDMLRSVTGKSTKDHIQFKVIEKAKGLLLGTDMNVSEIAYQLGFEYPQYFNRLFKEKTGFTPKEYRLHQN